MSVNLLFAKVVSSNNILTYKTKGLNATLLNSLEAVINIAEPQRCYNFVKAHNVET